MGARMDAGSAWQALKLSHQAVWNYDVRLVRCPLECSIRTFLCWGGMTKDSLIRLRQAVLGGGVTAIFGTGVSMALTDGRDGRLSWKGLVSSGLDLARTKSKVSKQQSEAWGSIIASEDLDELLTAAEFVSRKLEGPKGSLYASWIRHTFSTQKPTSREMVEAVRAIAAANVPICTLNYDTLAEDAASLTTSSVQSAIQLSEFMRGESRSILHLHGVWREPAGCVLGIRDYEGTLRDDVRDLTQRALGAFKTLIFVGCGATFSDPNFSSLIRWLRASFPGVGAQHFVLVSDDEYDARQEDASLHGFAEPVAFGPRANLAKFICELFQTDAPMEPGKVSSNKQSPPSMATANAYRAFLIRDCGQMTIEGVRADMDTAQRRFDLEKLFVPLTAVPAPPEIPLSDPEREKKLEIWTKRKGKPLAFGDALKKHRRMALLALPGGGKSILLKRLAVAYADPARRKQSTDALPELDLLPILIRCREWRDHITKPISWLLQNLDQVTGQQILKGFFNEITENLQDGRVMLLVDGLDEIHNDGDRSSFVENLEKFLEDYPQVRLVVTSREAGFGLVAPSIARFCDRWRIAPLEESAIRLLCEYWHRLMAGDGKGALDDAYEVAERLLSSPSLRRLAENPLLLTMLLVVKHGAGRLPPDRVSLYERAVEVLLDTWNIKGHEALNLKEAVPQLACVAYEMMRLGVQTITEEKLLQLLEEARDRVPQIRRYAKDDPVAFLKRVELRSSLLVEGGHQLDGGKPVPFYQFRHLTFQEYLSAVAAVQGHYFGYSKSDTILTPLGDHLLADEWKEVIPMAAVSAGKQAEPLVAALVREGAKLRKQRDPAERSVGQAIPPAISRVVQCLSEEAEASPDTLQEALQIVALFARGCHSSENWEALVRGPYGEELRHQAWTLYSKEKSRIDGWLRNSVAAFFALSRSIDYWNSAEGQGVIGTMLRSDDTAENAQGLLVCAWLLWGRARRGRVLEIREIERLVSSSAWTVRDAAVWTLGLYAKEEEGRPAYSPSRGVLDTLAAYWFESSGMEKETVSFSMSQILSTNDVVWKPELDETQIKLCVETAGRLPDNTRERDERYEPMAAICLLYYSESIGKESIVEMLDKLDSPVTERMRDRMRERVGGKRRSGPSIRRPRRR